jgi:hypothetical protein
MTATDEASRISGSQLRTGERVVVFCDRDEASHNRDGAGIEAY